MPLCTAPDRIEKHAPYSWWFTVVDPFRPCRRSLVYSWQRKLRGSALSDTTFSLARSPGKYRLLRNHIRKAMRVCIRPSGALDSQPYDIKLKPASDLCRFYCAQEAFPPIGTRVRECIRHMRYLDPRTCVKIASSHPHSPR